MNSLQITPKVSAVYIVRDSDHAYLQTGKDNADSHLLFGDLPAIVERAKFEIEKLDGKEKYCFRIKSTMLDKYFKYGEDKFIKVDGTSAEKDVKSLQFSAVPEPRTRGTVLALPGLETDGLYVGLLQSPQNKDKKWLAALEKGDSVTLKIIDFVDPDYDVKYHGDV